MKGSHLELVAKDVCIREDEYQATVVFKVPHALQGWDCLTLERDWGSTDERPPPIWVGRRMPLYSGYAGITRGHLRRNGIELSFTRELAAKLQLPIEIHISFSVAVAEFELLREVMGRIFEGCEVFSVSATELAESDAAPDRPRE
jgi:hypothetical protein